VRIIRYQLRVKSIRAVDDVESQLAVEYLIFSLDLLRVLQFRQEKVMQRLWAELSEQCKGFDRHNLTDT